MPRGSRRVAQEEDEHLVIAVPDAVVQPRAVVVLCRGAASTARGAIQKTPAKLANKQQKIDAQRAFPKNDLLEMKIVYKNKFALVSRSESCKDSWYEWCEGSDRGLKP